MTSYNMQEKVLCCKCHNKDAEIFNVLCSCCIECWQDMTETVTMNKIRK